MPFYNCMQPKNNTEEYEALLEQARHDAIRLQGHQKQNWDKQKYFKRLERQRKKQQEELRKWENHMFQSTEEVFKSRKAAEMKINKTDWNLVSAFFFAMKEAIEHENKLKEQKEQETEE